MMIGNSLAVASMAAAKTETARAEAVHHAAQELEGFFMSMLLKQMRDTVGGEGLFPGDKSDVQGSLFDMFLGKHLAEAGGLGVESFVEKYADAERIASVSLDASALNISDSL